MKKLICTILVLATMLTIFSACGKDEQTDEESKSEQTFAIVSQTGMPEIAAELVTEDEYQFIELSATDHIYKVTELSSIRSHILTAADGSITIQTKLTNSSARAKKYSIALWQTDGTSMVYLDTAYATADDNCYSFTFSNLDPALSYRIIVSTDRGYATGMVNTQGGSITQAGEVDENTEE